MDEIKIDKDFIRWIPPLKPEELEALKDSILRDGCRDPLVVWEETGLLLDGHNRFRICTENNIRFNVQLKSLPDRESALDWIDRNQLGRRNLTPEQMSLLRGRRYNRLKKAVTNPNGIGGKSGKIDEYQNEPQQSTAETLSQQHGVSPATIKRDGQYADAVESVAKIAPEFVPAKETRQTVIAAAQIVETIPEEAPEIIAYGEKEILAKARQIQSEKREQKRQVIIEKLESVQAIEAKTVTGVFDVIVIDPPWPMQKIERDERPNQSEFDYPTMTESELGDLVIPCFDDCHVFLWTTHRFLPMAFRLIDTWGMQYSSCMTWHKNGGFQVAGFPQLNCEFCLYARKGSPAFIDTKDFKVCFDGKRREHSRKPDEFYQTITRVTSGRRLDMFTRETRDGWTAWGNEKNKFDVVG